MLPGQPVSLPGPGRDEHGPGVGVNTLGQHLLGQESKGNQQRAEQEQRAEPQIHQRCSAPRAAEQQGPVPRRQVQRCHCPELCWPRCSPGPCSAQASMGTSPAQPGRGVAAGTARAGQQRSLWRDTRVVRPQGTAPLPREGKPQRAEPRLRHWARGLGTQHPLPAMARSRPG